MQQELSVNNGGVSVVRILQACMNNHSREMLRKARQQQHNRKAKQHNTTCPKTVIFIGCLEWDSNLWPSAFQAMLLPTKLPRQLSWMGQILYTNQHSISTGLTGEQIPKCWLRLMELIIIFTCTLYIQRQRTWGGQGGLEPPQNLRLSIDHFMYW